MQVLWSDAERVFCRGIRGADACAVAVLVASTSAEQPARTSLDRLAHEYSLKDELDSRWALRPVELLHDNGRAHLIYKDPGGVLLVESIRTPMDIETFLRVSISIAVALGKMHGCGLIHKDIKPAHILVDCVDGHARLTGFGLASRLPRERQAVQSPDTLAGTLAYMAPEQTGRMNRSVDSRSDLYAFGVTLYQMLTGSLPFSAAEPMEWLHCHIARTPMSPSTREATVSPVLSRIVMKLLAKTAEERYQSATGLEQDLRRCMAQWQRQQHISEFTLDERGTSGCLSIPEKLYGRDAEVETLVNAFTRTASNGQPELVLVCGYSGIGKSSVVHELHRALVPARGLFAGGKFDQYKRDVPYATLVQAFHGLVRTLLSESDAQIGAWRDALQAALGADARLMSDLIPELKLIIGEPPPLVDLAPALAQRRFLKVFRAFIGVFARVEHPLVLFLDDLQWLDVATLNLLEELLTRSQMGHLLLIGAYRSNEVDASHPLSARLQSIEAAGGKVQEIVLAPLATAHIEALLVDAMHAEQSNIAALAQLILERTGGNPFFVIRFLQALVEKGLLAFGDEDRRWHWDADVIHAQGYTDNVVDLMVGKLLQLPPATQQALQELACLGDAVKVETLSCLLCMPTAQVHSALWPAMHDELILCRDDAYGFAHDRIQEAAYQLIAPDERAKKHLQIGRVLLEQTPQDKRAEAIFDIVGQLNRGAPLMDQQSERQQLAQLNWLAGERAKASTAYASALRYFTIGAELLDPSCSDQQARLVFALEFGRASCEFLTRQLRAAEARLARLSGRVATVEERTQVACLQVDLYLILDQSLNAVTVCLEFLCHLGIDWTPHPSDEEVREEYLRISRQLGSRSIGSLIDLAPMQDATALAALEALTKLIVAALHMDGNLPGLAICRAINLSIEFGNSDASCVAYANVPRIAGRRFADYPAGLAFAELGCRLVERRGLERYQARTRLAFLLFAQRWAQPLRTCVEPLRQVFEMANRTGDLPVGAFAGNSLVSNMLATGEPLADVQAEAESGLAYARKIGFAVGVDFIETQLAFIQMLRGQTPLFGSLESERSAASATRNHRNATSLVSACWRSIRTLQARYFAGDYEAATRAGKAAQQLLRASHSFIEEAEYVFYSALTMAARCSTASGAEQQVALERIAVHHQQLQAWADLCKQNYASHAMLLKAEMGRVEGRALEAEQLYEQAIHLAQAGGYVHIEALANELASRFYTERRLTKIARMYLQDARYAYQRWGADGKVRQLEAGHSFLQVDKPLPGPTSTIATPVEQLDMATVLKVSQAASSEIVLEKLIEMVMRTAIEQAGAERGVLILLEAGERRIAAQATTREDLTQLSLRDEPVSATLVPQSILLHVLRTEENLFLDDALHEPPFAADPYVVEHRARSVLCLPLLHQAQLIGALYLENNLAPRVFSPTRIAALKLVACQAAISLVNARLYRDIEMREAKIRRLVDADIIGILFWTAQGEVMDANDAFLRMVGYEREDLLGGRVRWRDMTPPEFLPVSENALAQALVTGRAAPFEKQYLRKDGSRLPALVGLALLQSTPANGVAFVLDLTERKLAEAQHREGEQRYREIQTELAHACRVATMGQLAASIAHEVSQPLASTLASAQAAVRWLAAQPADVEEVRLCLERIVKDANRGSEVLARIRGLIRKAPQPRERVNLNEVIGEVIEITRGQAEKSAVVIRVDMFDDLPAINGDRVELQQVVLNLIMNALEAMSGMGTGCRELRIRTQCDEAGQVLVSVSDSGPGFGSHLSERLFTPFYTTKPSGLGMGLAICRSTIEVHGGQLRACANQPCGAVVQFVLPAEAPL
ncbi:trifunctional serine/threonine-protein kinase/ATP-binding protein/sensor histidine kinase [Pseudomonas granadensis]|uniref:trifunctional serine/threonine-protein kinase/ATP-binding protein/sensor histidine kinase n=1 Tax=Pseudomonas granadensis TaxID=1421430 RepID=UPI000B802741|nr:AAA family ATPase [Pseudomonas granadensis]